MVFIFLARGRDIAGKPLNVDVYKRQLIVFIESCSTTVSRLVNSLNACFGTVGIPSGSVISFSTVQPTNGL